MHKNGSKILPHQKAQIGEIGTLVTKRLKVVDFCQVWPLFMHLDTRTEKVHNMKHVDLRLLSVTKLKHEKWRYTQ